MVVANPLQDKILSLPGDLEYLKTPVPDVARDDFNSPWLSQAFDHMEAAMDGIGVGMAGPQMGYQFNIFAMRYVDLNLNETRILRCINPKLTPINDGQVQELSEGCLSIPDKEFLVKRHVAVTLSWRTSMGKKMALVMYGHNARIAQHETDHNKGLLICDIGIPIVRPVVEPEHE